MNAFLKIRNSLLYIGEKLYKFRFISSVEQCENVHQTKICGLIIVVTNLHNNHKKFMIEDPFEIQVDQNRF